MENDSGDRVTEPIRPWYCGEKKAEARVIGSRVVTYEYVTVNGCGAMNRPAMLYCNACGRRKGRERKAA